MRWATVIGLLTFPVNSRKLRQLRGGAKGSDIMVSGTFEVITEQDLGEIAKGAKMLPGAWTIDPVVDIRPPVRPSVWLHPAPPLHDLYVFRRIQAEWNILVASAPPWQGRYLYV